MSEHVTELDLQAYADGKLPDERRAAVAAWLVAHPEDAERIEGYRRLAEELRSTYQGVLDEPVPERLKRAVHPFRMQRAAAIAATVLLSAALGGVGGWYLHSTLQPAPAVSADPATVLARRAAIAHATYSPEVRHPVEVGADQEAHLVTWLSKRLGTQLRAPKLEGVGYNLVGGRLLPGELGGPVAHFLYQCNRGTRVSLYVRSDMAAQRPTAFRYAREGPVDVFYWVDGRVGYALSSGDISRENLLSVANAAYQQLNPP